MAEGADQGEGIRRPEPIRRVALFLQMARHFLDYAGLFSPLLPDGDAPTPLDPAGVKTLGELAVRAADRAAHAAASMEFSAAAWYADDSLVLLIPGYAGFCPSFLGTLGRWGFRQDAPMAPLVMPADDAIPRPLSVGRLEMAAMERGWSSMATLVAQDARIQRAGPVALTPDGMVDMHLPVPVELGRAADGSFLVKIGDDEFRGLSAEQFAFAAEVIREQGRPVRFRDIQKTYPILGGANQARLKASLPGRLGDLIESAAGYRFAIERL